MIPLTASILDTLQMDAIVITPLVPLFEQASTLLTQVVQCLTPLLPWLAGGMALGALAMAWAVLLRRLTDLRSAVAVVGRNQSALAHALVVRRTPRRPDRPSSPPPGHELALAVADELVRMRRRVAQLPADLKAADALSHALGRLDQHLQTQGYTVRDMSGEPYVEGMRVNIVNYRDIAGTPSAGRRVLRMVRPQVLLRGVVIEPGTAEVETERSCV